MISQQLTNHYLQNMGVTPWRRRQSAHINCSWQLTSGIVTLYAYVHGVSSVQQRLLWNNICDVFRYGKLLDSTEERGFELAFGEQSVSMGLSKNSVVMYSLAELVAQPQLKAEVWNVLKCKIDC